MMTKDCVVAVFNTIAEAERAAAEVERRAEHEPQVSLIGRGRPGELAAAPELEQGDAMEKSAAVGAGAGAALGLLAGASLLVVPGIGPVVFAGAMASGITGGLVGGIVGAMSGWGLKNDRLADYEQEIRDGKALVVVTGNPRALAEAESLLQTKSPERVAMHAEPADATVDE